MNKLERFVRKLRELPQDIAWVDFVTGELDPDTLGEELSALANGAALAGRQRGYLVWGVEADTRRIVGSPKDPQWEKTSLPEIETALRDGLSDDAQFEFRACTFSGKSPKQIGVFNVNMAQDEPVTFNGEAFIRTGGHTIPLDEAPDVEDRLERILEGRTPEEEFALQDLTFNQAMSSLELSPYFETLNQNQMSGEHKPMSDYLIADRILVRQDDGQFAVTKLGALLFARKLSDFPAVAEKAFRIVRYVGKDREMEPAVDTTLDTGYVAALGKLVDFIREANKAPESPAAGVGEAAPAFPAGAVREVIANALIHQDLEQTSEAPTVEIFDDRMEFTNPGTLLVDQMRLVDGPALPRNIRMAELMRRTRKRDKPGQGWDRIALETELMKLSAPRLSVSSEQTRITLFTDKPFMQLEREERLWATYLHACTQQIDKGSVTNTSLRERFGLGPTAAATVSKLIREAVEREWLKPVDPKSSPRNMSYMPVWAF